MRLLLNVALILCVAPVWVAYETGAIGGPQLGFAVAMIAGILFNVSGWLLAAGAVGFWAAVQTGAIETGPPSAPMLTTLALFAAVFAVVAFVLLKAPQYTGVLLAALAGGLTFYVADPEGVMAWTP